MNRPTEPRAVRLPVNRAFVVQFADGGTGELLTGRIEHLDSGQMTHFASLSDLGAFVEGVLEGLRTGDSTAEDLT